MTVSDISACFTAFAIRKLLFGVIGQPSQRKFQGGVQMSVHRAKQDFFANQIKSGAVPA